MEPDDIIEVIDSHSEELSVDDLMDMSATKDNEEESDEVGLKVKEIIMKEMAGFFKLIEDLAQAAMDMDPSLERSQHFRWALQGAVAPYKTFYAQKQNAVKQITIT